MLEKVDGKRNATVSDGIHTRQPEVLKINGCWMDNKHMMKGVYMLNHTLGAAVMQ